jgi:two-component sensor histidine kinase
MNLRNAIISYWAYLVRMPRLLPILVFAATLFLTILSTVAFERSERKSQQLRLQVKADEVAATFEQNMATNIAVLRSGRALFAAVDTIDRANFAQFVNELQMTNATRGVKGVGWSQVVSAADVPTFENRMRMQGQVGFKTWPVATAEPRQTVHAIAYIEPRNIVNNRALGYNMYSEPVRRSAMRHAAQTGLPTATESVILLQDRAHSLPGLLLYVPVYRGDVSQLNPTAREAQLQGFVYSPIGVLDFVKAAHLRPDYLEASMSLYDDFGSGRKLLYQTADDAENDYSAKQSVSFANRKWQLVLHAERGVFLAPLAAIILAFGVALSVLLWALTALILLGGRNAQTLLLARQEYETVRNVLTRELTHRVKNTLATVTSLAMLTRRGATSVDAYADALTSRLRALSATHDLLTQRDWSDAPLRAVLEAELAPFSKASDVRLNLTGPDVILSPNIALSLGLAIHELVTNAAKYGAFSVKDGIISIDWAATATGDAVRLEWQESNGPAVEQPKTRGFGSDLVEKLMARELNSDVKINFHPQGVRCSLTVPILKS